MPAKSRFRAVASQPQVQKVMKGKQQNIVSKKTHSEGVWLWLGYFLYTRVVMPLYDRFIKRDK